MADVGSARARWRAGLVVALALALAACEGTVIQQVNDHRWAASVPMAETSDHLILRARAHSRAMCSAGAVSPSPDLAAAYLGEGTTFLTELVGRAPLPPAIADLEDRNQAAADAIWAQWAAGSAPDRPPLGRRSASGRSSAPTATSTPRSCCADDPPIARGPATPPGSQLVETIDPGRVDVRAATATAPTRARSAATRRSSSARRSARSATATTPLWVKMRGGGAGWFDADGSPAADRRGQVGGVAHPAAQATTRPGLMAERQGRPEGFRILIVSMCSHDIYAGNDNVDPYNPNTTPDGGAADRPPGSPPPRRPSSSRWPRYPTDDYFLHGTSAGGVGTFDVGLGAPAAGHPPDRASSPTRGCSTRRGSATWPRHGIDGSPGCEKATEERGLGRARPHRPGDRRSGQPAPPPGGVGPADGAGDARVEPRRQQRRAATCPSPCPLPDGVDGRRSARPTATTSRCASPSPHSRPAPGRRTWAVCVEGGDAAMPCDRHVVTTINERGQQRPGAARPTTRPPSSPGCGPAWPTTEREQGDSASREGTLVPTAPGEGGAS